jgi:hypothetical protein
MLYDHFLAKNAFFYRLPRTVRWFGILLTESSSAYGAVG